MASLSQLPMKPRKGILRLGAESEVKRIYPSAKWPSSICSMVRVKETVAVPLAGTVMDAVGKETVALDRTEI